MQTLGLSDTTPRSESRLKSLFWPSVQTATDVDYLGTQGYWVCALVAVLTCVFLIALGHGVMALITLLFYYLGGVGVRERSRYAAVVVLTAYVIDVLASGLSVPRVLISALLLSNLRATWIAARWKPDSEEAILPPRLNETLGDKLADQLPMRLWPKVRIFYYIYSVFFLLLLIVGFTAIMLRRFGFAVAIV